MNIFDSAINAIAWFFQTTWWVWLIVVVGVAVSGLIKFIRDNY